VCFQGGSPREPEKESPEVGGISRNTSTLGESAPAHLYLRKKKLPPYGLRDCFPSTHGLRTCYETRKSNHRRILVEEPGRCI